jgi:predicted dehydrogenase
VVGAGNVANLNVSGYLAHPDCDVVAVCDVDADLAKQAAGRWGVDRVTTELDELLDDPDVDAVEVLTPTHLHHRHVLDALAAGKHVSVQKPIANTVAEANEMAAAAEAAGRVLRVSECMVHYPPLERAKQLIAEGAIGRPTGLRMKTVVGQTDSDFTRNLRAEGYGWRLDARSPGGHLFDDMVHKYAVALWLFDQEIVSVQAVVRRRDLYFEPCVALFEYADPELLGSMDVHYAPDMWMRSTYYGADEFFEIQGDEGLIWVTRATGEMLDMAPVVLHRGTEGNLSTHEFTDLGSSFLDGFERSAAHFVDALVAGTTPRMTALDAARVLQLCFAVYQASDTRQPVDPRTISGSFSPSGWAEW